MSTPKPDLTRVWANGAPPANVVDPDTTTPGKVNAGWQAEVPPFEHFNFLQKWFTQGLAHFNEEGVGVWDTDTTYPIYGLAKGSDGEIYQSVLEQSGNDPVSDDGANWKNLLGLKIGTYECNSIVDATFGNTIKGNVKFQTGDVINVKSTGAVWDTISGTGTANGIDIVAHNTLDISFVLRIESILYLKHLEFQYGSTGQDSIFNRAKSIVENSSIVLDLGEGDVSLDNQVTFLNQIKIKGYYSKGETVIKTSFKKNAGFSDSTLIQVGDGVTGVQGFHMEGVYIDGNNQTGNGFSSTKTANVTLRDVQSENNQGIGIDVDGQWISNWYNVGSRNNANGGLLLRGDNREISDARIFGIVCNNNGSFQMKWAGAHGVKAVDIYSPLLELPADDTPLFVCQTADRCNIYGGQIAQQINKNAACTTFGTVSLAVTNLKFFGTYFQYNPTNTALHACQLDNAQSIDFVSCFNQGSGKYIDAPVGATDIQNILVIGGNYLKTDINDPNNVVTSIFPDNFDLGDINSDGIIHLRNNNDGKRLDLEIRDSGGSVKAVRIGQGSDFDEFGFVDISPRLVARTSAPANPQKGRIELADGVSWDPLSMGTSNSYYVWYTGSTWRGLHEDGAGNNLP